ncbi:BTAD domain-containing putative transcriptional regulator [Actinoplanes sp. HUAS TT8]|uniref:AfsR/SARP family transcriptional regulator n=1 Tax=Actinoplanes sp. HUAS TT8 TaxID=3447453 RepID=UPI003F527A3A
MRFEVLGPVRVSGAQGDVDLGATKLRTVLAMLLISRRRIVSDTAIARMLWDGEPPATSEAQIQTYISRIRGKFPGIELRRQRPGYLLNLVADTLDLDEFEQRAASARQAAADKEIDRAAEEFRVALRLWRGPALGGVTEQLRLAEARRLEEARLEVLEERIALDLQLDRGPALVVELIGLVAENPLRERLRGHLMVALSRAGRLADALANYREYTRTLADELGLEPGRELQELHQRILRSEPRDEPGDDAGAGPTPAQLPPDVAELVGRRREVEQVLALMRTSGQTVRPAIAVVGMAGVGKSALAIHAAHRLRDDFPDGQIYVNLRGDGEAQVTPDEAVAEVLRTLLSPARGIPAALGDKEKLYRSWSAGKRVLLVLDNAESWQQVRPLLPNTANGGLLVTCRTRLASVGNLPTIDLGVLDHMDGMRMLSNLIGAPRVSTDPLSADRIVELCGSLPLAVSAAAAQLTGKSHWTLARFAEELGTEQKKLDLLSYSGHGVRNSLARSYRSLSSPAAKAMRLLAMPYSSHFVLWNAAVTLDASLVETQHLLDELVDARLLQAVSPQEQSLARYVFHQLVRSFARERLAEESVQERLAAFRRSYGQGQDRDHQVR